MTLILVGYRRFTDSDKVVLGESLTFAGQPEEAIGLAQKAIRLNPRSPNTRHFITLGRAYFLIGRYEEAIAALKEGILHQPNLGNHILLAAIYGELGREEEARAEATEVLRISPNFSLEAVGQRGPYKDPAQRERMLAGLRKAGLK